MSNIRAMVMMLGDGSPRRSGQAPLEGRNFVLSIVASRRLDPRNLQNLEILWPPGMRDRLEALGLEPYAEVTWGNLRSRRFPHLTGYAGRRLVAAPAATDGPWAQEGSPLIADLTLPGGIVVGFSSGHVRYFTWRDLGLDPPDGPVRVGPEATHELLAQLSDE